MSGWIGPFSELTLIIASKLFADKNESNVHISLPGEIFKIRLFCLGVYFIQLKQCIANTL